jgi:glycosyltransferase involved in cell wall biosynthesis
MIKTFNYIVPIFNKEDVLPDTLNGIEKVAQNGSHIFLIVDGCTDRSEQIVDEYIKNSTHKAFKILMPNVHMLLSVNEGLRNVKNGFSIIMQDDIILEDVDTEIKLIDQYNKMKNQLGVISFRYGSNIRLSSFKEKIINQTFKSMIEECDFIKGPDDYANYMSGEYGIFYERMSAINGPNCIPWELLTKIGLFDENLAPYGFDDPEYCLRSLKAGFINGLFPIKYRSDEEWGGTRRSKTFLNEVARIHRRNKLYIANMHGDFIKNYYKK